MIPLVSVIIPTYNRKQIVCNAIDSVLTQTLTDYEIIVVDDGSTDGTVEYLKSLNLPINIILKENGGVSSARNTGIKASKGELIALLDSDDIWLPEKLQMQIEYMRTNNEDALVYTDEYIEVNGKIESKTRFQLQPPKSKLIFPAFVDHTPIHTSSVMIRRAVLDSVGLFDEDLRIHEDSDLWNRVSEKYDLGYIEKPLVIFKWEVDKIHLMHGDNKKKFVEEGKKYIRLYESRRSGMQISEEESVAIKESYKILAGSAEQ